MTPWEHHPALTRDRLVAIAKCIQKGRNSALDRYDPAVGCDPWTVGCEAFAFQKHEIIDASLHFEWLEILNPSMEFVFSIGGVPVRFYRGEANEPHERTLRQTHAELLQMPLFSSEELVRLTDEPLYRFAVETDIDGSVAQVSFIVLDGAAPVLNWVIPLDAPFGKVTPLRPEEPDGVELPPPSVGKPKKDEKEEGAEE
jgi:hypothetical protein